MTKRIAVVGYTLDPRHAQKQEDLGIANYLGSITHPTNYANATVIVNMHMFLQKKSYVPQYMIFMKPKRTGLIHTAGRTVV